MLFVRGNEYCHGILCHFIYLKGKKPGSIGNFREKVIILYFLNDIQPFFFNNVHELQLQFLIYKLTQYIFYDKTIK